MRTSWFKWSDAFALEVQGVDAERYLHNRLTQNIKGLRIADHCETAMTDATSRVQGLFTVIKKSQEHFILVSKAGDSNLITSAFKQFIVADRIKIASLPGQLYYMEGPLPFQLPASSISPSNVVILPEMMCWAELDGYAVLRFGSIESNPEGEEIPLEQMTCKRVCHKMPLFGLEVSEKSLCMDVCPRSYVAFGAGCYVGQEVIEKVDARGKAPNILLSVTFEPRQPPSEESNVEIEVDGEWLNKGKLLSWGTKDDLTYAFILTKNANFTALKIDHQPAKVLSDI
jgi:folate-binding Fe-S cluster repair protein YgfZ